MKKPPAKEKSKGGRPVTKYLSLDIKACASCKLEKDKSEFYKDSSPNSSKDGHRSKCKSCEALLRLKNRDQRIAWHKNHYLENKAEILESQRLYNQRDQVKLNAKIYWLKKVYGLTIAQYNELITKHDNLCAICRKPEKTKHQNGKVKSLAIDHCHKTGKIRGLLCYHCNTSLGKFNDDVELILRAALYLKNGGISA